MKNMLLNRLQCSICSEILSKPLVINCGHTFCKYCLDKWIEEKGKWYSISHLFFGPLKGWVMACLSWWVRVTWMRENLSQQGRNLNDIGKWVSILLNLGLKWASLNKHDENLSGSLLEIVIYGCHILIKGLKILWVSDNFSPDMSQKITGTIT